MTGFPLSPPIIRPGYIYRHGKLNRRKRQPTTFANHFSGQGFSICEGCSTIAKRRTREAICGETLLSGLALLLNFLQNTAKGRQRVFAVKNFAFDKNQRAGVAGYLAARINQLTKRRGAFQKFGLA